GGTNMAGALEEAFATSSPASRLPFVIFVTDGLPSVGEQDPERIAARAESSRGRARVFAFGVGYDVNTYLLDRLSAAARGGTQYVKPGESVERPLAALAAKIRFPVLTDLRIGNTPARIEEVYPMELPDLFADEELVIVGRYRNAVRGAVSITGRRNGRTETFTTVAEFANHRLDNDYIPKIWASRKVGYLAQRIKLHGRDPEIMGQLRETALRYGILSEYTSYLVQEPPEAHIAMAAARRQFAAAAPAAPHAAVGQSAVASAEVARRQREAKSVADAAIAEEGDLSKDERRSDSRMVAGRSFRNENGVWTDAGQRAAGKNIVVIEPFSPAYFALLRALPELEPYWKAFTSAVVTGRSTSVKLATGGVKQLSAARVAEIVKQFRN
ncbi:MAG: hypothetical protein ACT4O1_02760, partial [Gemmatimonadota bacterium]